MVTNSERWPSRVWLIVFPLSSSAFLSLRIIGNHKSGFCFKIYPARSNYSNAAAPARLLSSVTDDTFLHSCCSNCASERVSGLLFAMREHRRLGLAFFCLISDNPSITRCHSYSNIVYYRQTPGKWHYISITKHKRENLTLFRNKWTS